MSLRFKRKYMQRVGTLAEERSRVKNVFRYRICKINIEYRGKYNFVKTSEKVTWKLTIGRQELKNYFLLECAGFL